MHYGKRSFAYRGTISMMTHDPAYQNVIGQRRDASPSDFLKICAMYGCATCMAGGGGGDHSGNFAGYQGYDGYGGHGGYGGWPYGGYGGSGGWSDGGYGGWLESLLGGYGSWWPFSNFFGLF
ncbi:hypothetical protein GCK32_009512 [Trichostrongylus colubriformis]|uniref:Peptidase M12A domain-containing protein n=1 Tax=Trichostrongylus colubriformis TaxID=6319 RepID=A0AAN8J0P1_TRICO